MTMIDEAEERRMREVSIQAAATLLSGSGADAPALIHVADVIGAYILNGAPAAHRMLGAPAPTRQSPDNVHPEASPRDTGITVPDDSVPARVSRAQELANEGYAAADMVRVAEIMTAAEGEGELFGVVEIDGKTGHLKDYLNMRLRHLPPTTPDEQHVPAQDNEGLRAELGL